MSEPEAGQSLIVLLLEEAAVLESFILAMNAPRSRVLKAFYNKFHNVGLTAAEFPTLGGYSQSILDDTEDLMVLCKSPEEDLLTKLLRHCFAWLFVVSLGPMSEKQYDQHGLIDDKFI